MKRQAALFGEAERVEVRGGFIVREIERKTASAFVDKTHRHLPSPPGDIFRIGAFTADGKLCGVVVVGRPVARLLDNGSNVEITRLATDGSRNLCSILYGAACRVAFRKGFAKIITYTRVDEPGSSLRAANFTNEGVMKGCAWDRPSRPRKNAEVIDRVRWSRVLRSEATK